MKKSVRNKTYILVIGGILAMLVLLFGAIHQAGYVFSGVWIVKGGSLTIENTIPNSTVFIDNKRVGTISGNRGNKSATFTHIYPGTHTVIVSSTKTWPWIMQFTSLSGQVNSFTPLQILRTAQTHPLTDSTSPKYIQARTAFENHALPTKDKPLIHNGTRVWVDGTNIYKQALGKTEVLFTSTDPIRSVLWYKDSNYALIVATKNVVVTLDMRGPQIQNYLPMYTGVTPEAVKDTESSQHIFVHDGDSIFELDL